jgi:hypothetical protein
MSDLINCAACGYPHVPYASWCKARNPGTAKATPYQQAEADRIERLAIERHNATRLKPA